MESIAERNFPADVFSDDAQTWFDLDYAETIIVQARTQLAAARIALALLQNGLTADLEANEEELVVAAAYHTRVIDTMKALVSDSTPAAV